MTSVARSDRRHETGQAVAEFSMVIIVLALVLVGIFDLGRGVYMYNGVSEAAREVARRTIVHQGDPLGTSAETVAVVNTQKKLVPGLATPTFACVDVAGTVVAHDPCQSGEYVRVTATTSYAPISLLGLTGPITLTSSASMMVPSTTVP
jgi:Flp pilus assembly protein TadG